MEYAMAKKRKGKGGGKGFLLEQCVKALRMLGIPAYSNPEFQALQNTTPPKYIITNFPHPTLYGTAGRKEGYVSCNGIEYIIETKFQDGSGSVDEKLPHVWESFIASPVANWIVVYSGRWWKNEIRGRAAILWFKQFAQDRRKLHDVPANRQFLIVNLDEFYDLAKELWG
jgi:hypothetical protein